MAGESVITDIAGVDRTKNSALTSSEIAAFAERCDRLVTYLGDRASRVLWREGEEITRAHDLDAYYDGLWDDYLLDEAQALMDYLDNLHEPIGGGRPPF
ncbi:MAG TPA: hypothetical protein VFG15_03165 [Amycolatopsis sp.]|nr:hypothetical protein [Amycolatopsis sp.]